MKTNTRKKLIELMDEYDYPSSIEGMADHLIANGVTVKDETLTNCQQWVAVTERLPEEKDRYLCNVKSFAFPGCFYHAILQYDKEGFREGNIYTDDVTHWMPLPELPRED